MKRIALVLAIMAIVGLMAAGAWAGCPGMGSKSQGSEAGKVPEGTSGEQAGDMPSGCHMQMNPGTSGSSAGEVGQADVEHAKGCCGMMSQGMCAQRMNSGCPMMMGQAPGCGQGGGCPMMSGANGCRGRGPSGRHAEYGRDSKSGHGRKHRGHNDRMCKSGGMECRGHGDEKAHMKCGQMACEPCRVRHGYATVIL